MDSCSSKVLRTWKAVKVKVVSILCPLTAERALLFGRFPDVAQLSFWLEQHVLKVTMKHWC